MDRAGGASTSLRWGRAGVLAMVTTALAAAAHVTAGGLLPGPVAMIVITGALTASLASLLGRPAGRARVVALLVLGQTAVHGVFTATAGHATPTGHTPLVAPSGGGVMASDYVAAPGSLSDALGMDRLMAEAPVGGDPVSHAVAHTIADLSGANLGMAAMHVLAAAAVGLWLAAGERILWSLLGLLTAPLLVALTAATGFAAAYNDTPAGPQATPTRDDEPLVSRLLRSSCVARRGPPLLHCA